MNGRRNGLIVLGAVLGVAALILAALTVMPFSNGQSYGAAGCCKKRGCPDDSCTWYVWQGDYKRCEEINEQMDGDNVNDESGVVWWDPDC